MTPRIALKPMLLKMAAFTALAAGLTMPAAQAAPPAPAPKPAVPALAVVGAHWNTIVLQHATLGAVRTFTGWDRGNALPEGVDRVYFLESNHSILAHATQAGLARMQEIVRVLDVAPRQVQIKVATATVSAAALDASGLRFNAVLSDGLGATGKPLGVITKVAGGDAVGVYLAALTGQNAISQAPVVATVSGEEAYIDLSHIPNTPGLKSAELGIAGRINTDGSVTVRLEPILSRLIAGRTDLDGIPAAAVRTFQTVRTVRSGDTLVLVNPLPPAGAGAGDRYLLLFVTPTVVAGPDPARSGAS